MGTILLTLFQANGYDICAVNNESAACRTCPLDHGRWALTLPFVYVQVSERASDVAAHTHWRWFDRIRRRYCMGGQSSADWEPDQKWEAVKFCTEVHELMQNCMHLSSCNHGNAYLFPVRIDRLPALRVMASCENVGVLSRVLSSVRNTTNCAVSIVVRIWKAS